MMLGQDTQDNTLYKQWNLKNGLGYLLILIGVGAAVGVLFEIYTLFISPQELAIFQQLFPNQLTISWDGGHLTLPPEILAFGLPFVLLSIAGGMANTLIRAGTNLIRSKS